MRQIIDPRSSRLLRWTAAGAFALIVTLFARLVDDSRTAARQTDYSVALARQIVTQAEGLALAAQQKKIPDPLGWTTFQLSQGVEPRHIHVSRLRGEILDSTSTNPDGSVEVIKSIQVTDSEQSGGVRVHITSPETMAAGSKNNLSKDLYWAAVFLAATLILGFFLEIRSLRHFYREAQLRVDRVSELTPIFRETLLGLGTQIRDIFAQFESVNSSSKEALGNLGHARNLCHDTIQQARRVTKRIDEISGWALHAEATVLNLMIESTQSVSKQNISPYQVHLLHQQLLDLRQKSADLQSEIRQLENGLEPVTTDLDIGHEALTEARESLRSIPEEISKTASKITEQARTLTQMKKQISG
ncbi:MAG: hypothetical protein KGQ59_02560 [Bdellovibrionales bacterium]|nr:hypothetical protein [Bdellovibrionales bacterium]